MGKSLDNEQRDRDEVGELIANYVVNVSDKLDARAERAAKAALIDSIAVAIAALRHPAAQNARKHAYRFANSQGCVIWGTPKRAAPELAALTNGVLLRCHDYNDFFVGRRNSGHSSDILSGVIAAAEWTNASGKKLLSAVAGKCGLIQRRSMKDGPVPVLRERLNPRLPLTRVSEAFMKRWPVGSVAQSAIQAAIDARSQIKDLSRIQQIRVFAEEGAYDHLVKIRQDPWNPISRETADHSLPYIVAAAVLDGTIGVASFTPKVVLKPARQAFIKKVTGTPAPAV